jgi:hypothetical protein
VRVEATGNGPATIEAHACDGSELRKPSMGLFMIRAGDFRKNGLGDFNGKQFIFQTSHGLSFTNEKIPAHQLVEFRAETLEANSPLGSDSVGRALPGPVSIGGSMGGREPMVNFKARFLDGRQLFATTDVLTFAAMKAALCDRGRKSIGPPKSQYTAHIPEPKQDEAYSRTGKALLISLTFGVVLLLIIPFL